MNEYNEDEMFDENTVFVISDIEGFCDATRDLVAYDLHGDSRKKSVEENLDDFITLKQIESIVQDLSLDTDHNDDEIRINIDIYEDIIEEVSSQIYGTALAKLAADGFLESAWDENLNDMVFWVKDPEKNDNSK